MGMKILEKDKIKNGFYYGFGFKAGIVICGVFYEIMWVFYLFFGWVGNGNKWEKIVVDIMG